MPWGRAAAVLAIAVGGLAVGAALRIAQSSDDGTDLQGQTHAAGANR